MQGKFSMELAGRTLSVETGKYAEQAGGSALMRCGDTAVLVCATVAPVMNRLAARNARESKDFFMAIECSK